jgi:hypothetical protein
LHAVNCAVLHEDILGVGGIYPFQAKAVIPRIYKTVTHDDILAIENITAIIIVMSLVLNFDISGLIRRCFVPWCRPWPGWASASCRSADRPGPTGDQSFGAGGVS